MRCISKTDCMRCTRIVLICLLLMLFSFIPLFAEDVSIISESGNEDTFMITVKPPGIINLEFRYDDPLTSGDSPVIGIGGAEMEWVPDTSMSVTVWAHYTYSGFIGDYNIKIVGANPFRSEGAGPVCLPYKVSLDEQLDSPSIEHEGNNSSIATDVVLFNQDSKRSSRRMDVVVDITKNFDVAKTYSGSLVLQIEMI